MERLTFIDSNIWCYYFDRYAQEHNIVAESLERILAEDDVVINTVVAIEVAHYLIKNLGPKGKKKADVFLSYPIVIADFDQSIARKAIEYLAKYSQTGIGGRDATILASMQEHGIKRLMTHDRAFSRIDFIEVIDPVA
jgi:predicted nucleic acid-binding protein